MKSIMIQNKLKVKAIMFLTAILLSTGIFAQKSLNYFEVKNMSNELLRNSYDIIAEIKSSFESDFFFEEQIKLEDWMIDLKLFAAESDETTTLSNKSEVLNFEEGLETEDWMMETDWNYILNENFQEEVLKLEKWMCCPDAWKI